MNTTSSPTEKTLTTVLSRVGCMSMAQAKRVITKYCHATAGSTERVFLGLKNRHLLDIAQGCLINRNKDSGARLNRNIIKALYYALDKIETEEELRMMFKSNDPGKVINFVAVGQFYEVYALTEEELYKIKFADEEYKKTSRKLKESRVDVTSYNGIYVFLFESDNPDRILDMVGSLDLEIPHCIVIFKPKQDMTEWMKYEEFRVEIP